MKLEVGKYYRFTGKCGGVHWSKKMQKVLDGEPRKCTYYMPMSLKDGIIGGCFEANFEGVPIPDSGIDLIGWIWCKNDIFEEVQKMEPIVGKKYWVSDCVGDYSKRGCFENKRVYTFLCKSLKGKFIFVNENGSVTTWKYFVPVPDDTYEIVHKKDGKEIGRASLTEEQLKVLGIS